MSDIELPENNNEAEESVEYEYVETSPIEYIQSAYFSIAAVDSIDLEMITKEEARRVRRIKKMAIELIYESIAILHSDFFDKGEDEED